MVVGPDVSDKKTTRATPSTWAVWAERQGRIRLPTDRSRFRRRPCRLLGAGHCRVPTSPVTTEHLPNEI
jgi:hypothetical protein